MKSRKGWTSAQAALARGGKKLRACGMHRMRGRQAVRTLLFAAFLLSADGCSVFPLAPVSPTAMPSATARPTALSVRLYEQVTLVSVRSEEHGQPLDYTITTQTPRLTGSDDSRVKAFNDEVTAIVSQAVTEFKQNLLGMPAIPGTTGSSFEVKYALLSPPGDILSVKYAMAGYVAGAAHPFHVSRTANFDLERGKDVALADLFLPGSNYLAVISQFCIAQLRTRDIGFDESYADAGPAPENYGRWSITGDGLLITFDEYQVAAYAAGPQTVVIPYADLASLIENPGPLTPYLR